MKKSEQIIPPQQQKEQPGKSSEMNPPPQYEYPDYRFIDKLLEKVAVISGGDSGIGRAVAYAFAREGADIAILYLNEDKDAEETVRHIEKIGQRAIKISGNVGDPDFCQKAIEIVTQHFEKIDILVNNSSEQHEHALLTDIPIEELKQTFETNILGYFYLTKAALPHISDGGSIINTSSVTAYKGSPHLLDYSATKGAMVTFTRSLSQNKEILKKKIRVNSVAPGPVWTPLIPSSFSPEQVEQFGKDVPLERPAQPWEIARAYVFLASNYDSSYITGQTIHVNGGTIVNG